MPKSANRISSSGGSSECVRVVIRCRPLNKTELAEGYKSIVTMDTSRGHVTLKNPRAENEQQREFTFDSVYDWNSKQLDLYDETFRPLIDSVLNGFNGTIFAYGQTGTGKTYTMEGIKTDSERRGVIPNSFEHIFNHIARSENKQYLVRASYLEIYQEEIRDLLSKDQKKRLELKERPDTGTYVKDLSSFVCKSVKEIEHVMSVGNNHRSVGATNMNEHSSRSHAIFLITIECSETSSTDNETHIRVGKLNMVDLAGSERQAKTGATGQRLKEATKINLSLSALGNVISALVDGKSTHIPYRDSKLTRLLQDSLGGNARTVMVANLGPASYNYDETLGTLRYANRAKNIKNKPKINEDPKDALLREFQEEIARLKSQLANRISNRKKSGKPDKSRNKSRSVTSPDVTDEDEDKYMAEEAQKLEVQRAAILNDSNILDEERQRLLSNVQEKEEQLDKERSSQQRIRKTIQAMESKLLSGGKNIVDHTNEQQRALEVQRRQIAEQKRREREMLQRLEAQEETRVDLQQTYTSLQHEVEVKTKKLKKLFTKLQAVKQETIDVTEEFGRDRRELEETQNSLLKELKLKCQIIENFIPPEERAKLLRRAHFDDEDDQWLLVSPSESVAQSLQRRPVSAVGSRRPLSEYARTAASIGGGIRYKAENIMSLELDRPTRTTRDYEGPQVAPRVQAALDAALTPLGAELEIDADISANVKGSLIKLGESTSKGSPNASTSSSTRYYPQSRGLVPK